MACYAERGWSGFSFESVSKRAEVGRPALYRRWSNREALLIDAFRESTGPLKVVDQGTLFDDLTEIGTEYRQLMSGHRGRAGVRLFVERDLAHEVFNKVSAEITAQRDELIASTLRRAMRRGEVRKDANIMAATELLVGALMIDSLGYHGMREPNQLKVSTTVETLIGGIRK